MWSLMRATDAKEHEIENLARFVTYHCERVRTLRGEMLDPGKIRVLTLPKFWPGAKIPASFLF